jgi:hypothetical protein
MECFMPTYAEKLKDPRWQKVRLKVLERDGWRCVCCGNSRRTLHVHHLKYNKEPWDADPKHLETLCEHCHKARSCVNAWFMAQTTKCILGMREGLVLLKHHKKAGR